MAEAGIERHPCEDDHPRSVLEAIAMDQSDRAD
jgi:hypothetical protein